MPAPRFDDLHDLDKGAVLAYLWHVGQDGRRWATEEHPCQFLADPVLAGLGQFEASYFAVEIGGTYALLCQQLGDEETERLRQLAVSVARALEVYPAAGVAERTSAAQVMAWLAAPGGLGSRSRRPLLLEAVGAQLAGAPNDRHYRVELRPVPA